MLELQIQLPAMGSQNGVEQFVGTEKSFGHLLSYRSKGSKSLTSETSLGAVWNCLSGIRVVWCWRDLRASVLYGNKVKKIVAAELRCYSRRYRMGNPRRHNETRVRSRSEEFHCISDPRRGRSG